MSCDVFSVPSRFRWIECQLKTLKRCFTTVDIRKVLDNLPIGLGATYEQILVAIKKEERGVAISQRVLVWLVTALRPLQLCQIVEILSIDVDRRTLNPEAAPIHGWALLDSLGSLVIHYEETDIFKLSYFSVKVRDSVMSAISPTEHFYTGVPCGKFCAGESHRPYRRARRSCASSAAVHELHFSLPQVGSRCVL